MTARERVTRLCNFALGLAALAFIVYLWFVLFTQDGHEFWKSLGLGIAGGLLSVGVTAIALGCREIHGESRE